MLAAVATACNVAALEVASQPQPQAQLQSRLSILAKASELLILSAKRVLTRQHGDTPGGGGATTPSGASANCNLGLPAASATAEAPAAAGDGVSGDGRSANEEDVGGDDSGGDGGGGGGGGGGDGDEAAAATVRRHHAIYEIVDSEESYVNKLRFIAEKYIPLKDDPDAALPPDLAEKWSIIWGNWRRLLEGHEEILTKLKQAFQTDIDSVAGVFIAKERHMTSWYSKYCENHRKAQHIACEQHREFFEQVRQTLRDKEDMNSHLMSPVQRCMRYSLLVGTVIDKARKDGLEGRALSDWERMRDIMRELPLKTESIMEASRIDNLEPGIRITALGQMRTKGVVRLGVLPGPYNPSSNPPPSQLKFEQRKIFLFDQMMLVTEAKKSGKAKTASDQFSGLQTIYIYRSKVKMNNMRHFSAYKFPEASGESSGQLFCVADTTPGANVVYVFDPVDADTRAQWVAELRQMEQQQQDFLKVLQNPVMASGGAGDQASGGGGAAGGGPGGSGAVDSGRKSVKDKSKTEGKSFNTSSMRLPNKWG
ncbi:hypothetical protein BOX15_Mlig021315g1 [Macrostomum lignano]|uniref:DH domain-containing protein n=2 Tax=Macrostomum lignano TaxID=282301 RepID=A0A267GBX8_9PLAT|nr:hypothetical protein BOX15_Mlig021315g1 [Macrostomum lignano]